MNPRHLYPEHGEDGDPEPYPTGTRQREELIVRSTKDEEFWYWDGNVILLLEGNAFKLHASRLESYCGYFRELFRAPMELVGPALMGQAEGCRVYHLPPKLSTGDFKHLLRALESPLGYFSNPPSQELAISLLVAADALSCDLVLNLAKNRLAEIWDGNAVLPVIRGSDSEDRTYPFAIRAIKLARRYSVPGMLRRAFYELLSSRAFWNALEPPAPPSILDELQISEADICTLLAARLKLGLLWREFIMQMPEGEKFRYQHSPHGNEYWCCKDDDQTRAGGWRSFVVDKGALEVFDPLRYDFMAEWSEELRKKGRWCQECVDRKQKAAEDKRREWWERMDELFGL